MRRESKSIEVCPDPATQHLVSQIDLVLAVLFKLFVQRPHRIHERLNQYVTRLTC